MTFDNGRPKAYSYLRFSTPEQSRGDSYRRQVRMAEKYADRHDLDLDREVTFEDRGVSAYRGRNLSQGRLRDFEEAVRSGDVEEGSYLLLENLDRFSRQDPLTAAGDLKRICELGVTVVTLSDGQRFTMERLRENQWLPLMVVMTFARSYQESREKGRRVRAAWDAKREEARENGEPLTKVCPGWMEWDDEAEDFRLVPEKVQVLQRIFEAYLGGNGISAITKMLNEEGVPTFGTGERWYRSYITKILDNPAAMGTYIPHLVERDEKGKRVRKPLDPIPDYYPAAVDPDVFQRAKAMRRTKAPKRGRHANSSVHNVFGGIAECSLCGGTAVYVNKGQHRGHGRYIVCGAAKAGAGCEYRSVPYHKLEEALIDAARGGIGPVPSGEEDLDRQLRQVEYLIGEIQLRIERLLRSIEEGESTGSATKRLSELEGDLETLQDQRANLVERREAASSAAVAARLRELEEALLEDPLDREQTNLLMRQVFETAVVDQAGKRLTLRWQQGGETKLVFGWPEPAEDQ